MSKKPTYRELEQRVKELEHIESEYKKAEKILKKNEELRLKKKDGTEIICSTTVKAVKDENGNIKYFDGIVENITERKKMQEALQKSQEKKYEMIFNNVNDAIYMCTITNQGIPGKFIEVNDVTCNLLGYTRQELMEMTLTDIVKQEDVEYIRDHMQTLQEKGVCTCETQHITKNNINIPVEIIAHLFSQNQEQFILATVRDITERKQAEKALRESEERYRSLFEGVPMGLYRTTPDGQLVDANHALVQMLGYPDRDSLLAIGVTEHYVNATDRAKQKAILESGEVLVDSEVQLRLNDGTIIWAEDHARPVCDTEGRVMYYEGAIENITQRKQAEQEIKQTRDSLQTIVDNINAMIYIAEPDSFEIIMANAYIQERFGDVEGKKCWEVLQKNQSGPCKFCKVRNLNNSVKAKENLNIWETQNTINQCWYENHDRIIRWIDNRLVRLQISTDVTDWKKNEKQLQEYASNMKILLQEVNHRVKNNLSAIISMIHMEQDRAEAQGLTSISPILQNINDRIGGLSTVHSLLSSTGWQPLKICDLCQEVVNATLQGFLIEKNIDLKISPSPLLINSNQAHHLTLVINELATNTIKHGMKGRKRGSISINIKKRAEKVEIIFRDDGPGYPDKIIQKDFTPLSIGFNLIKGIIRQNLHGKVVFKNKNGACTYITFPKK